MKIIFIKLFLFFFILINLSDCHAIKDNRPEKVTQDRSSFLYSSSPPVAADFINDLSPTDAQSDISTDIMKILYHEHYRKTEVNDRLSEKVFDRYFSDLDSSRSFFLVGDIDEFQVYRHSFDDFLKIGELRPAFKIFKRYQERVADRLVFLINRIENGLEDLDFHKVETIEVDRKDSPRPERIAKLNELWNRRLKNDVLSLKLAGKPLEEITRTLSKRYRNQLNRLGQTKSEDVFRIFMNSLTSIYDPHTTYFSPRGLEDFNIQMRLSLEGIGAVLRSRNEYTQVVRLISAGPADKGGQLKPGDRIVGVGQNNKGKMVDVIGWRLTDVVQLIRGPKETVVRLEIIPADTQEEHETKTIRIERSAIKLEEQAAKKEIVELKRKDRTYKIGIIDIPTFYLDFKARRTGQKNYKSTTRDVRRLLGELVEAEVDGVIIDLRNNSGGSMQEASSLIGLFIVVGPTVQIRNARGKISELVDADPEVAYGGPLAVLVNRLSASSSEIFAGAIQDYHRGIVVGGRTFGKGTVQTLLNLKYGKLKITTGKFYRVSGKSTQHKGVIPDILLPAVYEQEKLGENALEEALPWDKISETIYSANSNLKELILPLRILHKKRVKQSPDFSHLIKKIQLNKKLRATKLISLQESTRKKELEDLKTQRLNMKNENRIAKGLEPLKKLAKIEPDDNPDKSDNGSEEKEESDVFLEEIQNILIDLIYLSPKTLKKHKKSALRDFDF